MLSRRRNLCYFLFMNVMCIFAFRISRYEGAGQRDRLAFCEGRRLAPIVRVALRLQRVPHLHGSSFCHWPG